MAASIHNFHYVESSKWSICLRLTCQHFRLLNSLESRGVQWLTGSTCIERSALLSCEDDHKCLVHIRHQYRLMKHVLQGAESTTENAYYKVIIASRTRCRCRSWKSTQSRQPCRLPLGVWPKAKHWCPILPCGQTRPKYTVANYPARMCTWVRHPLWRMAYICDFEYPWFWSLHREPSASVCESSNRSAYPSHRT